MRPYGGAAWPPPIGSKPQSWRVGVLAPVDPVGGCGQPTPSQPSAGVWNDGPVARQDSSTQWSVWTKLVSEAPGEVRAWLLALGFLEDLLIPGEREGAIHHCQLDWPSGGRVLLSGTGERATPCQPGTTWQHVVTRDPDAVWARALNSGVTVIHPIADQTDYPAREFTVADPDGNYWTFSTFAG